MSLTQFMPKGGSGGSGGAQQQALSSPQQRKPRPSPEHTPWMYAAEPRTNLGPALFVENVKIKTAFDSAIIYAALGIPPVLLNSTLFGTGLMMRERR